MSGKTPSLIWNSLASQRASVIAATLLVFAAFQLNAVDFPLRWRWSNPAPHGADIADAAYSTGGLAVQVGERGQIYTSSDLQLWIPRPSHTDRALRGVTFLGGRIVISGERGTILAADDPSEFFLVDLNTSDWLESVAASSNLVVAVGDHAAIYTSTNGVSWARQAAPFTTSLRSVAWGPPGFVAVGESGLVASSVTGSDWTAASSGVSEHLNRVIWMGDRFWVVGNGGRVLTSLNGSAWQTQITNATNTLWAVAGSLSSQVVAGEKEVRLRDGGSWISQLNVSGNPPKPPPAWDYYAALWDGSAYWLGGHSGIWVQGFKTNNAGPMSWFEAGSSVRDWLWAITRAPSFYIAAGARATVLTSGNGIDWELNVVPNSVTNATFLGVGGTTNHYFVVGTAGALIHSTNGVVWEAIEPRATTNDLQGVAVHKNLFVTCGARGTLLTSATGSSWTKRITPTTNFLSSLTSFPNGWVAVGDRGTVLTSTNGTNWTAHPLATTNWIYQVRYLNDVLLAVGENGALLTSTDGANWTARNSGTTEWLTDAAYLDGAWFVVGTSGTVLASTNLTTWIHLGTVTRKSLFGAAVDGGQLAIVGVEGAILRSQVVPDHTPPSIVRFSRVSGRNLFLFGGKPDQQFVLERSADLLNWRSGQELEFIDGTGTLLFLENASTTVPTEFYRVRRFQ